MYVTNPEKINENRLYKCNETEANWLIDDYNIPLFGKTKDGKFLFAKTDLLEEVLQDTPLLVRITRIWS